METTFYILSLLVLATPAFFGTRTRLLRLGHQPINWRVALFALIVVFVLLAALGYLAGLAEYHALTRLDHDTCLANPGLCSWVDGVLNYSGWLVALVALAASFWFLRLVAVSWPGVLSKHAQS